MAALFGNAPSTLSGANGVAGGDGGSSAARPRPGQPPAPTPSAAASPPAAAPPAPADVDSLIRDAAHDLSEYQRLTAEGKLGEAGSRLDALKQKLERLQRR
jgi:hypothetical protein